MSGRRRRSPWPDIPARYIAVGQAERDPCAIRPPLPQVCLELLGDACRQGGGGPPGGGLSRFVTSREYLHRVTWPLGRGVAYSRPDGTLALVGLYLRGRASSRYGKTPAVPARPPSARAFSTGRCA
jgi:hypothetical protein